MTTYRPANAFDLAVFVSLDKKLFPYSPWSASQYNEEFSSPTRHFVVALDDLQSSSVMQEFSHQGVPKPMCLRWE